MAEKLTKKPEKKVETLKSITQNPPPEVLSNIASLREKVQAGLNGPGPNTFRNRMSF